MAEPDLRVSVGDLTLKNPILGAAGTFGYGLEFAKTIHLERLGAVVTKTLTRLPQEGNPPPRLAETPSGMLNAVGLQNVGLEAFLSEKLPALCRYRVTIIVSILADSSDDIKAMIEALERADDVAAIELNLSCPNLKRATQSGVSSPAMTAQDPDATFAMVEVARKHTKKTIIAKLSPDVTDIVPIAQAAERAGANALTLTNTFTGMSLDPDTRRSRLGVLTGGLSGPAIRPLAVHRVWYTAQHVALPLIGAGGIVRTEDAVEFFLAGASAVAVGTANLTNPASALHILDGLNRYLVRHKLDSIAALRGAINRQETGHHG